MCLALSTTPFGPTAAVAHSAAPSSFRKPTPETRVILLAEITPPSKPHPPVVGKVTHHSIELYWDLDKKVARRGPQEQWLRFSLEEEYPKGHAYGIIYT